MSALDVRGVSKTYGDGLTLVHALQDVDLQVDAGELVAIMGPSGSGKSTLLAIAGTLEQPTSGTVQIEGRDVASLTSRERAAVRRRSIGYVFQSFNLIGGLTALENVSLPLELDGMKASRAQSEAGLALERLGMGERRDHFPEALSGGEAQRVAIARAIVGDRRILLADEPTGALDTMNGEAVLRLLRDACHDGVAGVMVTHDAQLAAWADRVVFMRDGRIADQTAPRPPVESLLDDRA